MFSRKYNESNKSFVIGLYQTDKSKRTILQLGKPMTFNVSHFRDQKIHEIPVEFKNSFDSPCKGIILLRIQYVHNEEELFTDIVISWQNKEELIKDSIKILEYQRERLIDRSSKDKNFVFDGPSQEDSKILGAAFYSNTSDISDNDKAPLFNKTANPLNQQNSMNMLITKNKHFTELSIENPYMNLSDLDAHNDSQINEEKDED